MKNYSKIIFHLAVVVAAVSFPGTSFASTALLDATDPSGLVRLNFRLFEEGMDLNAPSVPDKIVIDGKDVLLWNGERQSIEEITASMLQASKASSTYEIAMQPWPNARFQASVDVFQAVSANQIKHFAFVENSQYQVIGRSKAATTYWPSFLKRPDTDPFAGFSQIFITTTDKKGLEPSQPDYLMPSAKGKCRA